LPASIELLTFSCGDALVPSPKRSAPAEKDINRSIKLRIMNSRALAAILCSAALAGGLVFLIQQNQVNHLRAENESLATTQRKLTTELDAAKMEVNSKVRELEQLQENKSELLKLRGEVAQLRRQVKETTQLVEENHQLRDALRQVSHQSASSEPNSSPEPDEDTQTTVQLLSIARQLTLSLRLYAEDNSNQLPTELSQISAYLGHSPGLQTNQFELLLTGSISGIQNPSEVIWVRSPTMLRSGQACRAYGYADGHAEIRNQPPEGFDAWEQAHLPPGVR